MWRCGDPLKEGRRGAQRSIYVASQGYRHSVVYSLLISSSSLDSNSARAPATPLTLHHRWRRQQTALVYMSGEYSFLSLHFNARSGAFLASACEGYTSSSDGTVRARYRICSTASAGSSLSHPSVYASQYCWESAESHEPSTVLCLPSPPSSGPANHHHHITSSRHRQRSEVGGSCWTHHTFT